MAIEAARQLLPPGAAAAAARLSDLHIVAPLALAAAAESGPGATIEIHTSLRSVDDAYLLEIVSSADGGAQWTLHCTGRLHFPPPDPPPPPPLLPIHRPSAESAQETGAGGELRALLESFGQHPPAGLGRMAELCIGLDATSGRLSEDADGGDGNGNRNGLGIGPAALSAILQLPSAARLAGDYPASHRITRIQLLQLSAQDAAGSVGVGGIAFSSRTTADGGAASFDADIAISARTEPSLSLTGVHFAAERLARPPPLPLRSLFFRPELRPDLTLLSPAPSAAAQPMEETLQLVTHKFPHADLCLADIEPTVAAVVVAAVGADAGADALCRRRHRSLHTVCAASAAEQGFGGIDSYHFLMVPRCSQALSRRVRAGGFVLAAELPDDDDDDDGPLDGFDRLHAVEVAGHSWQLLRRRQHAEPEPSYIISSVDDQLHALLARELPPLDDGRHFLSPQTPPLRDGLGEYKLVVYDAPSQSSPPRIPALPLLLRASRIVWISAASPEDHLCQQDEHQPEDWQNQQDQHYRHHQQQPDPFHGITSGFLRTLCSEHPHIAATHLVVQGACPPQRVAELARLLLAQNPAAGSCESEIVLRDGGVPNVRRYLPDDDRSRQMGLLPPRVGPLPVTATTAADSDWAIVAAPPADGGAVLVARPLPPAGLGRPVQQVRVLASVVVRCPGPAGRFGCFFAGTAIAAGNPMVAGWSPAGAGACVAAIDDPGHIVELGGASSTALPAHTVAAFAGAAIALLVADQARVRPGDRFLLRQLPPGLARPLGRAVRAHHAETITAADANDSGVFCVEWAAGGPLTLNGRPVPLTPQTITPTILRAAGQILEQQEGADLDVLPFNRFAALFEPGRSPLAVLQHDYTTGPVLGLAIHRAQPAVFHPSRVYVAVGGLGGVGRIVLPWMAARGARHIIVLSRSPRPPPPEMASIAAHIETVAVDACSLAGLQQALARIRRRHTIAGIVHLAAVLHDAPLATMSPHQWDAALQAKARTSWNLHLATRGDHGLEFFVMFSSVSGIVGTRGQANYAAGNAFQDALAAHRRSLGLPAVAIAVGMLGLYLPDGGKD